VTSSLFACSKSCIIILDYIDCLEYIAALEGTSTLCSELFFCVTFWSYGYSNQITQWPQCGTHVYTFTELFFGLQYCCLCLISWSWMDTHHQPSNILSCSLKSDVTPNLQHIQCLHHTGELPLYRDYLCRNLYVDGNTWNRNWHIIVTSIWVECVFIYKFLLKYWNLYTYSPLYVKQKQIWNSNNLYVK